MGNNTCRMTDMEEVPDCSVCLCSLDSCKSPITRLPCSDKHAFHTRCILQWEKRQNTPSCPLCRTSYDVGALGERKVHLERTLQATCGTSAITRAMFAMPDLESYWDAGDVTSGPRFDSANVTWDPETGETFYCEPEPEASDEESREIDYPSADEDDEKRYDSDDSDVSNGSWQSGASPRKRQFPWSSDRTDEDYRSEEEEDWFSNRRPKRRRLTSLGTSAATSRTLPTWPSRGLGVSPSDAWSSPWAPARVCV